MQKARYLSQFPMLSHPSDRREIIVSQFRLVSLLVREARDHWQLRECNNQHDEDLRHLSLLLSPFSLFSPPPATSPPPPPSLFTLFLPLRRRSSLFATGVTSLTAPPCTAGKRVSVQPHTTVKYGKLQTLDTQTERVCGAN